MGGGSTAGGPRNCPWLFSRRPQTPTPTKGAVGDTTLKGRITLSEIRERAGGRQHVLEDRSKGGYLFREKARKARVRHWAERLHCEDHERATFPPRLAAHRFRCPPWNLDTHIPGNLTSGT